MTELQFLIKTLTEEKLSQKLKDLFIARLGEVEASLSRPQARSPIVTSQAPSTQRILEENPIMPQAPIVQKRIIGGNVDNGDGTVGKRKF